jgi:cytosine/adenosine deaminase-related metal-dependent hydrolase
MTATTPGLVCAHHHIYAALARGMPPPPRPATTFREILETVWWRLDLAVDSEILEWSAKLAALEALESGTTTIIDHNETPNAIEGSLTVISNACAEVGVRVLCSYGVSDRHGPDGAKRGLEENRRYLAEGGRGYVGIHAAFTCSDETLDAAAAIAKAHGVGVHVHVCEGPEDLDAPARLHHLAGSDWLLAHCVHLATTHQLPGTIVHNPASNLNNGVGYANPSRFVNPVALGTDGIGADMLEAFRLAYYLERSVDLAASPERAWSWLATGQELVPDAAADVVTWSYEPMQPWHLAFTPGVRPIQVEVGGETVWKDGRSTRVDAGEIRAKAGEQAARLHSRL